MVSAQAHERVAPSQRMGQPPVLLLVACIVVPCAFDPELDAVFVVPKLALLWGLLAVSFAIGTVVVLRRGSARLSISTIDVAVASFVLLNVVAWLLSLDRQQSLYGERLQYQGLLTLFLYVGYFYVAGVGIRGDGASELRVRRFVGALLVSGYALVQRAGLDPVWKGFLPGGRVLLVDRSVQCASGVPRLRDPAVRRALHRRERGPSASSRSAAWLLRRAPWY